MDCAGTLDSYLADPVGRYVVGPTYAVWWQGARLNGLLFWDRPEEHHIRQVTRALDAELDPRVTPHASLVDARRVRAVDLGAFTELSRYVESRRDIFAHVVTRQALLRPGGLAGAAIAGFYAVLAPSYPVEVFCETDEALAWLGADTALVPEIDGLHEVATGAPHTLVLLRSYLQQRLGQITLGDAADALQTTPRQLQRNLRAAHTSFQREERRARVEAAKTLLLETNFDVKRIALEVGCASTQHFDVIFRKEEGDSPTRWRLRRREASRFDHSPS